MAQPIAAAPSTGTGGPTSVTMTSHIASPEYNAFDRPYGNQVTGQGTGETPVLVTGAPRPIPASAITAAAGKTAPAKLTRRDAFVQRFFRPDLAIRAWMSELTSIKFYQSCLGEFIGMMFFLFAVCTAVVFTYPYAGPAIGVTATASVSTYVPRIVLIAATFGLTITVFVWALAHISGGHLNPAVSLVLWLRGNITALRFVCYVAVQMAGACAGAAWSKSLNPTLYTAAGGAANFINRGLFAGMDFWTALGAEWFATAILCWAVLASGDIGAETLTKRTSALNPLVIGLAVFLCHLALIPIDGTSINPARSFGTASVSGNWTDQWVFWVGPFIGSVWALFTYEIVYMIRPTVAEAAEISAAAVVPTTVPAHQGVPAVVEASQAQKLVVMENGVGAAPVSAVGAEGAAIPVKMPFSPVRPAAPGTVGPVIGRPVPGPVGIGTGEI